MAITSRPRPCSPATVAPLSSIACLRLLSKQRSSTRCGRRSKRVVSMDLQSTPRRTPDRSAVRSSRWRSPRHRNSVVYATQCQVLIDAHLVRVAVLRDRLEVHYRADPKDRSETETLSIPWMKPASRVRRALLEPSSSTALSRPMESDERNRLILSIASARCWLEELVEGSVGDVAELAARRTAPRARSE